MSYSQLKLVSRAGNRPGLSGYTQSGLSRKFGNQAMGGIFDSLKDAVKGVVDVYGKTQQTKGQTDAMQAMIDAQAPSTSVGPDLILGMTKTTAAVVGIGGLAALVFILRK